MDLSALEGRPSPAVSDSVTERLPVSWGRKLLKDAFQEAKADRTEARAERTSGFFSRARDKAFSQVRLSAPRFEAKKIPMKRAGSRRFILREEHSFPPRAFS